MIERKHRNIIVGLVVVIIVVVVMILSFMQDRTSPQISISEESISYEINDTVEKLLDGCIATDNHDGDINEKIQIASAELSEDGTKLKLTYIVYDSNKNVGVATRIVNYNGGDMTVFQGSLNETDEEESVSENGEAFEESQWDENSSDSSENEFHSSESMEESIEESHGHTYEEISRQEATFVEAGLVTYQCSCGDFYTEELDKLRLTVPVLQELELDGNRMTISWEEVQGATGYVVYRLGNNNQWVDLETVESGTRYIDTKIESGKTYTYTVKAFAKTENGIIWGSYNRIGVTKTVE